MASSAKLIPAKRVDLQTMKSEKFAIVLILSLILVIAPFNIIGSLSMLIIDKRKDVDILRSLGADNRMIQEDFYGEGMLIAVASILGALVGLFICWLQVQLPGYSSGMGGFITDAYPLIILSHFSRTTPCDWHRLSCCPLPGSVYHRTNFCPGRFNSFIALLFSNFELFKNKLYASG